MLVGPNEVDDYLAQSVEAHNDSALEVQQLLQRWARKIVLIVAPPDVKNQPVLENRYEPKHVQHWGQLGVGDRDYEALGLLEKYGDADDMINIESLVGLPHSSVIYKVEHNGVQSYI